jgi:hypothetical protein
LDSGQKLHLILAGFVRHEAKSFRPLQQHFHRRRLPSRSATRRAFAHRFQPFTDRLKRDVGICALDASNNGGQAIVRFAAPGAGQHLGRQEAVADIGLHRAEQAALGPATRLGQGGVDDAQHILPGHVGPQAADMGHPDLRRLVQPLHIAVLSRQPHLAQSGRVFGPQSGVPADPALGAGARQPRLGTFADQRPLELGRGAQNLQRELALRGSGVYRVLNGTKLRPLGLQPFDHLQQMRQRPRKPVDPNDNQRVALANALQHAGKHRPRTIAA